MPELADQADLRAKEYINQMADMKIDKEKLEIDMAEANNSDVKDLKPKFKQHVSSITLNATYSKATDEQWKQLCIKNFDFI